MSLQGLSPKKFSPLAFCRGFPKDGGMDLPRIVESLLFATDRPLTPKAIVHALHQAARFSPTPETVAHEKVGIAEVEAAIDQLNTQLTEADSSLMVQGIAG